MRKKIAVVSIIICLLIIMIPSKEEKQIVDNKQQEIKSEEITTTPVVNQENKDQKFTLSINNLITKEPVMQTTDNEFYMNHNN